MWRADKAGEDKHVTFTTIHHIPVSVKFPLMCFEEGSLLYYVNAVNKNKLPALFLASFLLLAVPVPYVTPSIMTDAPKGSLGFSV